MKSKRAFTLVELMVVVLITVMMCGMLAATFESLQRSISISKRSLSAVAEAEFIFQVMQQDLRSMVSSKLSTPIHYRTETRNLNLFLSKKGYQGDRLISVVGYALDHQSKGDKLLRYSRSIGWDEPFFGVSTVMDGNALDSPTFRLGPQLLENQEEELSDRVIDFVLYYHYWDLTNKALWISREPLRGNYSLKAVTMAFVISNFSWVRGEPFPSVEDVTPMTSKRVRGEGGMVEKLPWHERFEQVDQELKGIKDKRITSQSFFRTVEIPL